jgi:predicted DCC family thiol-disulfide oxidoreductase YuxK
MDRWPFRVLIDGECPLCRREMRFLRRLDRGSKRLVTEDITAAGFDSNQYGVTMQELMGQIHGVLPDESLVKGMEVFRRAYDAVGLGWLLAPTSWPLLKSISDAAYAWFARNRLRLTGRAGACDSGRCRLPWPYVPLLLRVPPLSSATGRDAMPDSAQSPDSTWKQDFFYWTFPDLPETLSPATSANSRSNSGAPTVTIPR